MTELEFIETYAPALWREDFLRCYTPIEAMRLKISLAKSMYRIRPHFVEGITEESQRWIDNTAALTPMGAGSVDNEARARYEMARLCWSEVFGMKMGVR